MWNGAITIKLLGSSSSILSLYISGKTQALRQEGLIEALESKLVKQY
jgi:hypothetical protein